MTVITQLALAFNPRSRFRQFPSDEAGLGSPGAGRLVSTALVEQRSPAVGANLLRVRKNRHSCPGTFIRRGSRGTSSADHGDTWNMIGWPAEGSFVYRAHPGEIHTLVVDEVFWWRAGNDHAVQYHPRRNGFTWTAEGKQSAYEDVFTKIEMCRKHYIEVGLGREYVDQFVR